MSSDRLIDYLLRVLLFPSVPFYFSVRSRSSELFFSAGANHKRTAFVLFVFEEIKCRENVVGRWAWPLADEWSVTHTKTK